MVAAGYFVSKLRGKRVLVLGGTSGIGFCVAQGALEQGATVIVASSNQKRIDTAIQRLRESGASTSGSCTGYVCDLSLPETVEHNVKRLFESCTAQGQPQLDHIVFTAGDSFSNKPLKDTTVEDIQKCGNVRFLGALMVAKHAPSYMNISSSSSITLTGGVNSYKPAPGWVVMAAYGASFDGMMRGLAVDLKPVRVNIVAPGTVHTELIDRVIPQDRIAGVLKDLAQATLVGEIGKPEDIAEAYLYLMKDRFISGCVLNSDGGHLLR